MLCVCCTCHPGCWAPSRTLNEPVVVGRSNTRCQPVVPRTERGNLELHTIASQLSTATTNTQQHELPYSHCAGDNNAQHASQAVAHQLQPRKREYLVTSLNTAVAPTHVLCGGQHAQEQVQCMLHKRSLTQHYHRAHSSRQRKEELLAQQHLLSPRQQT